MCGHDSPTGSLFCLNCGNSLAQAAAGQTPAAAGGLPAAPQICPTCRAENPGGMKFCRNCGTVLAAAPQGIPPSPVLGGPGGAGYAPPPYPAAAGYAQPGGPGGPGGYGAPAPQPAFGGPPGYPPQPAGYPPPGYPQQGPPPASSPPQSAAPAASTMCPRCNSSTPSGFAFCQQCGFKLSPPSGPQPGVDAHGATLAVSGGAVANLPPPPASRQTPAQGPAVLTTPSPASLVPAIAPQGAAAGAAWGTAVSVNRDGSDGERYTLSSDYVVIGRAGSDIAFDQDRFLAREHARLEVSGEASRVVPLDALNGVFRKIDAPVELRDGSVILVGREVLRFESVDAEEKNPQPLVRHGVALFGSPPREPWGRLVQLLPSGGVRDVRYLHEDEIVLGREEGDLVFSDDAFLSRRHATIGFDGRRVVLTDLGSSNGTFIRLAGPHPLKHGEHLRMGDQLFRIELRR